MTEITLADMIRSGNTANHITLAKLQKIELEMMEEPCEICGGKTKDVGQLFSQDCKDEMGRQIVQMVCAKCMTKGNKPKSKPKKGGKK
jgi:tRNA U54 and U55 pseudouridine synthase Pus10